MATKPVKIVLYIFLAIFLFFFLELLIEMILMGCGVNVQEKLVPYMYETELKKNKLREHFMINDTLLNEKVRMGVQNMQNKKIVICAIARNVENCFPKCIDKIMIFTHGFKDYNIVIFENDSKDNTRNLLKQWAQRDSKVKLLDCCDDGSCDCKLNIKDLKIESGALSKKRIAKMAHFRNKYVDYVKKNYKDYDYMLVIDIDIRGGIYKEGYQSCFADDDWDAIFARGIRPFPFLFGSINYVYDWLAYADNKYKKKDLNLLDYIDNHFKLQKKYDKKIGETMEPIKSAFNGAGIYRIKTLINSDAKYSGINSCEHIDFNDSLKSYKLYANPSFIINMGVDNDMAILKK